MKTLSNKSSAAFAASFVLFFAGIELNAASDSWTLDTQEEWTQNLHKRNGLKLSDGFLTPTAKSATFQSSVKSFAEKRSAKSITIGQSPVWENWQPVGNIGPSNLGDAPVFLSLGPSNYWMFGRYSGNKGKQQEAAGVPAKLEGYDIPLVTTPFANQYDAPGGLEERQGGYHAWQSRDMVNWVHHGPVSDHQARWMTTAEYVDGKAYLYYDFPNDQDPHLIIDEDLMDGKIGKKMGMAFKDPSNGSDCAIIRDLDGKFHLIVENWDPIKASMRSWDSPLASHAVSENGIDGFKLLDHAVDYRTNPTGKFAEHAHPHWHAEDPENYPLKKGQTKAMARYEIHEPEQDAYGDWASIAIGGQYYLFGDNDPAGAHGSKNMTVAWFTSPSINEPFKYCGEIGKGHPDPDVIFAEGQFYLATQMKTDYVSSGPWVDGVEVRVGVDTDKDGSIDQWTDWQAVSESYDYIPGFAKQVAKTPAQLDLSDLPEGYGFQFEIRLTDQTENKSKPILDTVSLSFK